MQSLRIFIDESNWPILTIDVATSLFLTRMFFYEEILGEAISAETRDVMLLNYFFNSALKNSCGEIAKLK